MNRCSETFRQGCSARSSPSNIEGRLPVAARYTPPRGASDPPPHCRTVLLAANGQGHNPDGQGLPALPSGQGSQTRTPTVSRDTSPPSPIRPCPRRPGRAAASLARPNLCVHHHRLNLEMAGSHPAHIQPTAPGPFSPAGYRDLESQPPSHQTEGPNSRPPYGQACAACSTFNTHPRQHTILNQTDWSGGSRGG
jgi:hypothetical protein